MIKVCGLGHNTMPHAARYPGRPGNGLYASIQPSHAGRHELEGGALAVQAQIGVIRVLALQFRSELRSKRPVAAQQGQCASYRTMQCIAQSAHHASDCIFSKRLSTDL